MKKKSKSESTVGSRLLGLAFLTTIIFLILRWTNVIDWRWVWIFAPLWISMALNLVVSIAKDVIDDIRSWNDINRIR